MRSKVRGFAYCCRWFLNLLKLKSTKQVADRSIESKRINRLMLKYALSSRTIVATNVHAAAENRNSFAV